MLFEQALDIAATEDEKDGLSRCLELLATKVHTVQAMDDVDAKFRFIMDTTVSQNEKLSFT